MNDDFLPQLSTCSADTEHAIFTEVTATATGRLAGFMLQIPGMPLRLLNPQGALVSVHATGDQALADLRRRMRARLPPAAADGPILRDESLDENEDAPGRKAAAMNDGARSGAFSSGASAARLARLLSGFADLGISQLHRRSGRAGRADTRASIRAAGDLRSCALEMTRGLSIHACGRR